ncbi:hypothetical protein AMAG_06705 [Allomyces macrogynus ATCC 38327]|uniref:NrS-1 polymerase-like helicase domain-containing protein n=1 Tax=Allomyces macrogynus (strain ATCC 38327) TaxID=578462 RepID=A0A0L0SEI7_ALLM3|nr:hypothetical protein AMAG_06705 [Allomyces macrogynus ATCC 38327]|eukprot:KNE60943.1 hypothetical protein AMAG_06705 [Allomyces macrogynus ATCC 38327]
MNAQVIANTLKSIDKLFSDSRQVVLREHVNEEVLKNLCELPSELPADVKKALKVYRERLMKTVGEGKETVYSFSCSDKKVEKSFSRLYAKSVSLQNLDKALCRNPLAHGVLQDIDMVAAAPSILRGIFLHYKVQNDVLDLYVADRATALKRYGLKDKESFIRVLFAERLRLDWDVHPEVEGLHHLIYNIVCPQVMNDFPKIHNASKERTTSVINKGSVISNLCQAVESVALMAAIEFARSKGIEPSVLMFDGFMAKRDDRIDADFLELLSLDTLNMTGFDIKWAEKEIPAGSLPQPRFTDVCEDPASFVAARLAEDPYYDDEWAADVLNHMKTRNGQGKTSWKRVLWLYVGEFFRKDYIVAVFYGRRTIEDNWEINMSKKGVEMVVLTSEVFKYMPQVKKRIFDIHLPVWGDQPNHQVIDHYNSFHGFAAKHLGRTVEAEEIKLYLDYLKEIICCNRDEEYLHVLKWIQGVLTTGKANGVMLLLQGLEGTGKSMFYSLLKDFIIGEEYCVTINNIGKFIRGDFNAQIENKILVLLDEMPAESIRQLRTMFDVMKNWITDSEITINQKHVSQYRVRNVSNIIGASNNGLLLPVTKTARRLLVLLVSSLMRGNTEYFKRLRSFVKGNADAIYTYLVDLDLSHVDPTKFPRNAEREAMVQASMDPITAFIEEIREYSGFPDGLMGIGEVVTVPEMTAEKIYDMYHDYVSHRFPRAEPSSMKVLCTALAAAVHHRADGTDALLFKKDRRMVGGRKLYVYIYQGPALLELEEDEE